MDAGPQRHFLFLILENPNSEANKAIKPNPALPPPEEVSALLADSVGVNWLGDTSSALEAVLFTLTFETRAFAPLSLFSFLR